MGIIIAILFRHKIQDKAKPIVREGRNTTGLNADSRVTLCEWGDSAFLLFRQVFRLNCRKLLEIDVFLEGG